MFTIVGFGKRYAGLAIMSLGGVLFLFYMVTGLPNFSPVQLTVIPFFLLFGAMVEIAKGKKGARL